MVLRLNPNGRIPTLVDNNREPASSLCSETSAQLQYLVDYYDSEHKFGFADKLRGERGPAVDILRHGGGAQYQAPGYPLHRRVAPEKIPVSIEPSKYTLSSGGALEALSALY